MKQLLAIWTCIAMMMTIVPAASSEEIREIKEKSEICIDDKKDFKTIRRQEPIHFKSTSTAFLHIVKHHLSLSFDQIKTFKPPLTIMFRVFII